MSTVHCPQCEAAIELPEDLHADGVERMRCGSCRGLFRVLPGGSTVALSGGGSTSPVSCDSGEEWSLAEVGLDLIWVGPGSFWMRTCENGFSETVKNRAVLSDGFWMGKYPVTQKLYREIVGNNPSKNTTDELLPVESVTWAEAMAFCELLNQRLKSHLPENYYFTLPTEVQWEFACRCGGSFGDFEEESEWENFAWYLTDDAKVVGGKSANPWGFHDMVGNIAEWCYNLWEKNLPDHELKDWTGPIYEVSERDQITGDFRRVIRGGHDFEIYDGEYNLVDWIGLRHYRSQEERNSRIGFRVVLSKTIHRAVGYCDIRRSVKETKVIPEAGSGFRIETLDLDFIWCPPGSTSLPFATVDEPTSVDDLKYVAFEFSEGFWLSKYPIRQDQYRALTGHSSGEFIGSDFLPADGINFFEAMAFSKKLRRCFPVEFSTNEKHSRRYYFSPPTELEWMHAWLAGRQYRLLKDIISREDLLEQGWFEENSGGTPKPVGLKKANPWGFHDMLGNVAEITYPWWGTHAMHRISESNPIPDVSAGFDFNVPLSEIHIFSSPFICHFGLNEWWGLESHALRIAFAPRPFTMPGSGFTPRPNFENRISYRKPL